MKIFCVGANKTGTKSLAALLESFGVTVGDQDTAERMVTSYTLSDLAEYCDTAQAFQDAPFSLQGVYAGLDQLFPDAKFILTVRDSAEQWYDSLVTYITALAGGTSREEVGTVQHCYPGYILDLFDTAFGETPWMDKAAYMAKYESHNRRVQAYFQKQPDRLLVVNVADADTPRQVAEFLGVEYHGQGMPHLNSTEPTIREAKLSDVQDIADLTIAALNKDTPLSYSRAKVEALTRVIVGSDQHYSRVIDVYGKAVGGVGLFVQEDTFHTGKHAAMVHCSCPPQYAGMGARVIRDAIKWCNARPDIKIISFSLDYDFDPRYVKLLNRLGLALVHPTCVQMRS